jgi:predicted HicB family RNase H-like nuclease
MESKKKLPVRKPVKASGKKNLTILLRQQDTKAKLKRAAEADKRSVNSLVNKVLEEFLENAGY